MALSDTPRGGDSHHVVRADHTRPYFAFTYLGRNRSCAVRLTHTESVGRYRVWRIIRRLSYGVPRNQDAQRQSGLGNEPVSGGTRLHSSTRHFQRTGATRRPASLVHHKDWQTRAIEDFVSHATEYPLVNLPEAKRAHDQ